MREGPQNPPLLLGHTPVAQPGRKTPHDCFPRPEKCHRQRLREAAHGNLLGSGGIRVLSPPVVVITVFRTIQLRLSQPPRTSPERRYFGGVKRAPAPLGVPVRITSPGSRNRTSTGS